MRFFAVAAALIAGVVAQTNHDVIVGWENQNVFKPESLSASAGDTVTFTFVSKNHTVTQSSFAAPCTNNTAGLDSGYFPAAATPGQFPQWKITVANASAPLWFYCAQGPHCRGGMVFAINPNQERTFEAFKATATGAAPPAGNNTSGTPPDANAGAGGAPAPPPNSASGLNTGAVSTLALLGLVAGLML